MTTYFDELKRACEFLAKDRRVVFVGQGVSYKAHGITGQLSDIANTKKIELPVFENTQAGICLGMAIEGYIPVCVYPRWNFLILACDQIVNHIDKWQLMDCGPAKVIIKVATPTTSPLNAGHQHSQAFADGLYHMCDTVHVVRLFDKKEIFPAYEAALNDTRSTILVEYAENYNQ